MDKRSGKDKAPAKQARSKQPKTTNPVSGTSVDLERLAAAKPFNENTPREYGDAVRDPRPGATTKPASAATVASTRSEENTTPKTGDAAPPGESAMNGTLERVRVDSTGRALTTNQGVAVADNQSSLRAGLRGPTLLEDFILREKITHFDHERIPERIVHARGSGAHGYFEAYESLGDLTRAAPFAAAGKRTPVFVRFSTVAGERGSKDTARDVRGFAVKFYTDEGNWDLVGNNMPVFFIQDAIKFPDVIHAVKPEPHHGMPQAASAHDTFWDFISLLPESTHMIMWVMSDRALPRSYRMMQGFGVHSYRFVNAKGESSFVKFHWSPKLGTHSLAWDEAVKISGADPDYHRRDLWEAIEAGRFPEWEFGIQVFTEADAERYSFDILDATKIIPEELVPVRPIGRMVLDRNPDNFFAETEQVAFCVAHVIPGIDFTNDPLLGGRIHSYIDTQISRLGGPNFHEIPINAPLSQVHNNQRDGMHRQAIARGGVAYEPNSLGGGCPYQAGATEGFTSFQQPVEGDKLRGKAERFAEHYLQARLFYESQTPAEQRHIEAAFRFELSKVTVAAVRRRMVASLRNVSDDLAVAVASGLGMELPEPLPRAIKVVPKPEVTESPALSLTARPGDGGISTRQVAMLVADGVDATSLNTIRDALTDAGAVARFIGPRIGRFTASGGTVHMADGSLENSPSVVFDALVLPDGKDGIDFLRGDGQSAEFVRDAYRHCKTILALGESADILEHLGISEVLPSGEADPGMIVGDGALGPLVKRFIAAVGRHRHPERETDPPLV